MFYSRSLLLGVHRERQLLKEVILSHSIFFPVDVMQRHALIGPQQFLRWDCGVPLVHVPLSKAAKHGIEVNIDRRKFFQGIPGAFEPFTSRRSAPQLTSTAAAKADTLASTLIPADSVQFQDIMQPQERSEGASFQPVRKPEVLAPAGGWLQLRAAVENGADAVYFGLSSFNARARAANFAPEELPEVSLPFH